MNERESDPSGAFRGGSAGLEDDATSTEGAAANGRPARNETPGVDETEREVITSGTAATSEVGDPDAQAHAEGQGDGTPLPR
jgi:hypothetical protein